MKSSLNRGSVELVLWYPGFKQHFHYKTRDLGHQDSLLQSHIFFFHFCVIHSTLHSNCNFYLLGIQNPVRFILILSQKRRSCTRFAKLLK